MRSLRLFTSDLQAGAPVDTKFLDAWKSTIPNIDPPKTFLVYMAPQTQTSSTIPTKLTINVVPPYSSIFVGEEVDMVIIPTTTGLMGVLPGHVATIADVIAVEAVPVEHFDQALVQKGLADFTQKLSSASTDREKAEAQIGVNVHSALNAALTG